MLPDGRYACGAGLAGRDPPSTSEIRVTSVRQLKVENKLAKMIDLPGGMTLADALARADRNLDTVKDDYLAVVDKRIVEIESLAGFGRPPAASVERLYAASNEIVATAGVFGLTELGEAAYSFCELIDRLRTRDTWSSEAVAVHVSSLKLLRHPEAIENQGGTAAVLEGLRKVIERAVPTLD
jgi:hypothetical protein